MESKPPEIDLSSEDEVGQEERANVIDILVALNLSPEKDLATSIKVALKELRELIAESSKPTNELLNLVLQLEDELGEVLSNLANQYYETVIRPILTIVAADIIANNDDELILNSIRALEALQEEVARSAFADYFDQDDIQDNLDIEISKLS